VRAARLPTEKESKPTKFEDLLNVGDPAKKAELEDRHVLFMEDGAKGYLGKMFGRIN